MVGNEAMPTLQWVREMASLMESPQNNDIRAQKNLYWLGLLISVVLTLLLGSFSFFLALGLAAILFFLLSIFLPAFCKEYSVFLRVALCTVVFFIILFFSSCGSSPANCSKCNGNGKITCSKCDGKGKVLGWLWGENPCPRCGQTGTITCSSCGGTGKEKEK